MIDTCDRPASRTSVTAALIVAFLGLFAALCWPLASGRIFAGDDLAAFHLPVRYLYQQALAHGDQLLWSPALYSGTYLFGEVQAGMAHPLHWLLYRFLSLGVALNLEIIVSYCMMALGSVVLGLRLGLSRQASAVGALFLTFSGTSLLHLMHVNAVAVIAHLPWLLLCSDVVLSHDTPMPRAFAAACLSFLLGSQLLLGHPQYVWLSWLPVVGLVGARMRSGTTAGHVALWAAACLSGVMIGAVQLLPMFDVLGGSLHTAPDAANLRELSLQPLRDVLLLAAPKAVALVNVHELAIYNGAFSAIALPWVAMRWQRLPHRRLLLGCLCLLAIGFMLGLGPSGGLYSLVASLPGVSSFRVPARYLLLVHAGLAGIVAIVFEDLQTLVNSPNRPTPQRFFPLLLPLWIAVVTLSAAGAKNSTTIDSPSLWLVVTAVVTALVVAAARGARWAVPLIIVVSAIDLGLWGFGYTWGPDGQGIKSLDTIVNSVPPPPAARINDLAYVPLEVGDRGNLLVMHHLRRSNGYLGLSPVSALGFDDQQAQRISGVTWIREGDSWQRTRGLPHARLLTSARVTSRVAEDLPATPDGTALIERDPGPLSGPAGDVVPRVERPGHLEYATDSGGRQLLFVAERFHPGWHARVDGTATPVLNTFGDYMSVVVEAGAHVVSFEFNPDSFRHGLHITVAGLILTSLWPVGYLTIERRRRHIRESRAAR